MALQKDKKSFKKYAKKHLATVIENRRKGSKVKKEKIERTERKKQKEAKQAEREEKEHVDQLERLKETDPQFYSYLEEEDPTLLQFGHDDMPLVGDDSGSDAETDADEDEGDGEGEDGKQAEGDSRAPPSKQRIQRSELDKAVEGKRYEQLIDIFVSAAREMGYKLKEPVKAQTARKFEDPDLVKDSLPLVVNVVGQNLSSLLASKSGFKNHKTRYLIKRLVTALVSVLTEGVADPVLTAALLRGMAPFVPVLHLLRGQTKAVLKTALNLCATTEEKVRLAAYVLVRTVATRATGTRSMYQSAAFKGVFLALVRTAHQYTIHNLPVVAFLMNCVVDLYGTDMEAAYQHAFVYLRQLAIYQRAALQQQSQGNIRAVFNWQYLNALRTWGLMVSTYAPPAQLGPLIHPTVQLALGLLDLFSSPRMFPMHLHVIEMLNHIGTRTGGVYVPVIPYILRILTSPSIALNHDETKRNATHTKADEIDLQFSMRVKKAQARGNHYRMAVWQEALYLLTEHLATHSHTIGFPETFWAVESTLKKLRKDVKVPKINAQIAAILKHMEATTKKIMAKRDPVNFGPCDITAVKQFQDEVKASGTPLATYHQSLRQNRVDAFAAKQNNLRERTTLDAVVNNKKRSTPSHKRARSKE